MVYNIYITHTSPTFKQFEEWGIKQAYPTFYIDITFYDEEEKKELSFRVKITGHYYCSGSRNFEDIEFSLDTYKINNITKEQVNNLLNDQNIINNFKKSLKQNIEDSMIPDDYIGILEQLWDEF